MVCKDGIVMAADSEQSGFYRKSNVPKLESSSPSSPLAGGCSVIVAGAGNGELADYASHRIIREVSPLSTIAEVEEKIEEVLTDLFDRKLHAYKTDDLGEVRFLI